MRVLALDYGRARCGCAVSDPTGVLGSPIEAVRSPMTRRGFARLRTLVRELDIETVVVGLPVSLSGRDSAQTTETREFAERLAGGLPVPGGLYDERVPTRVGQRGGGEGGGGLARGGPPARGLAGQPASPRGRAGTPGGRGRRQRRRGGGSGRGRHRCLTATTAVRRRASRPG